MFDVAEVHAITVHAPLVLIPVSVALMLVDFMFPPTNLRPIATVLLFVAVGAARLAAETGNVAAHHVRQHNPAVQSIPAGEVVARVVGEGSLLRTHARLGELTRDVYTVLLLAEVALQFARSRRYIGWRRGWTLPARVERLARGALIGSAAVGIAGVVLTGWYGGRLVYDHGVGVTPQCQPTREPTLQTPPGKLY